MYRTATQFPTLPYNLICQDCHWMCKTLILKALSVHAIENYIY